MNNTDKTMNKEYKKLTGIGYLIFAVIAYLICAFVLAIIHPDINYLGIVFVELYFLCFWLLCYLFKPNMKPNPVIVAYIILFSIPFYFSLNYRYLAEIDMDKFENERPKTEIAYLGENFYKYKKCSWANYKGKAALLNIIYKPLYCNEKKYQRSISVEDENGNLIHFYAGRNFLYDFLEEEQRWGKKDMLFISYMNQELHITRNVLFLNIVDTLLENSKEEKNIVFGLSYGANNKFKPRYFQRTYKEQKNKYIFFSILFFINALAFGVVIYRIKRKYLNK